MGVGASSVPGNATSEHIDGSLLPVPQLERDKLGLEAAVDQSGISLLAAGDNYDNYDNEDDNEDKRPDREFSPPKPRQRHLKYSLGRIIGHGSFGQVYLALEHLTGKLLAVKEMVVKNCSREVLEAIDAETRILINLRHPNIVNIYDIEVSDDGNKLLIVMDFIAGGSLASLSKSFKGIPEILCRRYARQILEAIKHMHRQNVAHLDLKCSNIMIGGDGLVKLVDFGTATRLARDDIINELQRRKETEADPKKPGLPSEAAKKFNLGIKGSPYWIAPECVRSTLYDIFKADIWSIGCLFIEMFTTYPPFFQFKQVPALLYHIATITEPPGLPETMSDEGRDFLSKCLQINPEARASVDDLLAHPWVAMVNLTFGIHPLVPDKPAVSGREAHLQQSIDAPPSLATSKADKLLGLFTKTKDTDVTQSTIAKNWFGKSKANLSQSIRNLQASAKIDLNEDELDSLFELALPKEDLSFIVLQHDKILDAGI
ncbi:Kinase, STE STE11 [Giardia duodenalis]|uniref:Kinase, STE STE11 n=2 Tax=Giardia intestinalis TaxID=5741 RepID=A8BJ61_GIAIC|nr:Kinase, STE STE11 [Giardia intestinalis]ESU39608.1 Mitogen-activated protein kinase kinase kinase [Giardia intestinalis]KAE8304871.1 Kinase, STE STE11 [Giardia intestinalis]|eukprot:XP_001706748.1 Kinase, STE STE11 [Giardia lamblia ATCC 50803]